jgi:hypothetical protein
MAGKLGSIAVVYLESQKEYYWGKSMVGLMEMMKVALMAV